MPTATTGTPRVSRYSSVSGTSRIAFGPAHTTATGVRASSSRSAEMSNDAGAPPPDPSAPRWTPPMPPVENTRMPADSAAIIVAATVVAPQPPDAIAAPRFGRDTLRTEPLGAVASASSSSRDRPDEQPALVERDGRRHGAGRPDRRLGRGRHLDVVRVREPVADERGLEGDDGGARGERVGDLGGDGETVGGDHGLRVRGPGAVRRRRRPGASAQRELGGGGRQVAEGRAVAGDGAALEGRRWRRAAAPGVEPAVRGTRR